MKKIYLFIAALMLSFTAQATIVNCNPGTNNLSWYLTQGDTLVLADGEYIEQWSFELKKEGVVVMAAEGAKPIIKASSYLQHKATTTFIGITFDGQNTAEYATYSYENTAKDLKFVNCEFMNYTQYTISASSSAHVDSLIFENCVLDGSQSTLYAIYAKGTTNKIRVTGTEIKDYKEHGIKLSDAACVDALIVTNSLIHDCAYTAIQIPAAADGKEKQSCSSFELTNSTIYNIGDNTKDYGAVDIRDNANIASAQQVLIDHVTIYNFSTKTSYGGFMIYKSGNATISNCIAMNPADVYNLWINPFVAYTGATVSNCVNFNCGYVDNGATQSGLVKADPLFVDAANANFMLYAESPAVGMGDPRWGVKAGLQPGNGILSDAVAAAAPGATITLGDGIYEESFSFDFDKEGLTIVAAEGTNPVIKTTGQWTSLGVVASTTFDGITFDGGNLTKTSLDTKGTAAQTLTLRNCEFKNYTDYNINVAENTTINTITIDNCVFDGVKATKAAILAKGIVTTCTIEDSEFKNYAEYCITANDYYRGRIDNLSINNCLLHDGAVAVYMPKYADAGDIQTCADFSLTNSTIYNMVCTTAVIDIRSNPSDAVEDLNKVAIDHITIYNYDATNGAIYIAKTNDMSISNSIIATPEDKGQRALYVYGGTVDNTIHFNGSKRTGNTVYTKCENVDPMFVGATDANFDIYANSPAVGAGTDGSNLGDPRWGVSAKVLGKRINVTPDQASSLPWMIQSDESNVKAGDTIVLAAGTYELSSFELRKEGLVIMAAENAEVKIATMEGEYLKLVATTTFDGITFDGSNVANYAIRSIGTSAKNLIVRNCEFTQYARYNIYGDDGTHLDSLIVDNCIFNNSGAAIYFPASALADNVPGCSYAKVTNSTLYNIILNDYVASIDIQENNNAQQTGNTEVVIDHVTIYNFSSTAKSAIKVYKSGNTTITNTIVANPNAPAEGETIYSYYIYDGAKVQNSLSFNAKGQWASNAYTDTIHADPLFVDAANNNFMLQATSPAIGAGTDGSNLGDPRWDVAMLELGDINNKEAIAKYDGQTMDVKVNRTLKANDGWYTICVPFDLPQAQLNKIGKAYVLNTDPTTATYDESTGSLTIQLVPVTNGLEACMPYLILPSKDIESFVAEDVTIDYANGHEGWQAISGISFYSQTEQTGRKMDFEMRSVLYGGDKTNGWYWIGNGGYLYNDEVDKLGLRAYCVMRMEGGSGMPPRVRVVAKDNEATGLDNTQLPMTNIQKAIENGQLIIIRGGEKYNVQGQKL